MKTYHANPNDPDAVATALLDKYRDQEKIELRPEVLAFARLMELRLREKDADKGVNWKGMNQDMLLVGVASKFLQLEASIKHDLPRINHARQAVDLANYCMMIADVSGALIPSPLMGEGEGEGAP